MSFTIEGIHPHDIATILDEDGVAIRAGHHCCQILHDKFGLPATARASFGVYNTKEDIDKLNASINKCKKIFDKNELKRTIPRTNFRSRKNPRNLKKQKILIKMQKVIILYVETKYIFI